MSQTIAPRTVNGVKLPAPGTFAFDANHTSVGFVVRHLMVSKVRGTFNDVSGAIVIAEDPLNSSVEVAINAASISTGQSDRDNHLRSADFLDVERFPQLTFRSTHIVKMVENEFVLAGELTVHGVTRPVELAAQFEGLAAGLGGHEVIGFEASTEIDRDDFGLTWNQALEAGGVLIGRSVKIEIGLEAIRQSE